MNVKSVKFQCSQVAGRSRTLKYIARIDRYDEEDKDYEGVYLEKVPQKLGEETEELKFVIKEGSEYSFGATDIVAKLPNPNILGGSSRRTNYLQFDFDFNLWSLAY